MKQQRELSRESSRCFIRYTLFMGIQATTHYPPRGGVMSLVQFLITVFRQPLITPRPGYLIRYCLNCWVAVLVVAAVPDCFEQPDCYYRSDPVQ